MSLFANGEENSRKGQNRTSFVLTHDIFFTGFLTERPAAMHSCPQSMKSNKIEPSYGYLRESFLSGVFRQIVS